MKTKRVDSLDDEALLHQIDVVEEKLKDLLNDEYRLIDYLIELRAERARRDGEEVYSTDYYY